MGRSSRILRFVTLLAAMLPFAQVALARDGRAIVRLPTNLGLRAPAPPVVRQNVLVRPRMPRNFAGFGQSARRQGFGIQGFGIDGFGTGLSVAGDLATPLPLNSGYGPEREPSAALEVARPSCVRPQIIKIGLGVRHAVRTRVVYGPPNGCMF